MTKIILIGENYTGLSGCKKYDNLSVVTYYQQAGGVRGLENGRKQVEPRWNEFNNNSEELLFQSEQILAQKENNTIENHSNRR